MGSLEKCNIASLSWVSWKRSKTTALKGLYGNVHTLPTRMKLFVNWVSNFLDRYFACLYHCYFLLRRTKLFGSY